MALAFVQKIAASGTGSSSFTLPSGGSTAGTLLVVEMSSADGATAFTPPAGGWVQAAVANEGNAMRTEIWHLVSNPGGLATAGSPVVFTGGASGFTRGTLTEWSSAAGTSQALVSSGTAIATSGLTSTVSVVPPPPGGAAAVAAFAVEFSSSQSGSWTSPGGAWVADSTPGTGAMLAANYHRIVAPGVGGGFSNLIGAAGNDPNIGCPTSLDGWTYANSQIGPLNGVKMFYNGALPANFSSDNIQGGKGPARLPAGVVPLLCYATPDTNVTSYVTSVNRPVILCWLNEAEDKSSYTYTQFKNIFERQSNTIRAVGNPNVQVAMVSIGYQYHTGVSADATAGRWIVPASYVDMYLLDIYQHYDNGGTGYAWPSAGVANWDQWQNWLSVVQPKNKPLGVAEYGIDAQMSGPPANDATCAARTARINADAAYFAAAFGPGGTISTLPMALWFYWYSACSAGQITTDLRHSYQFSEAGSIAAWQATQAAAFSPSASFSTGSGAVTGWASAVTAYSEAGAPPQTPPVITTASLPAATVGTPYSQTVTATGGTAPFTWTADSALPDGLALDGSITATLTISGTPAADAATSGFTITITDAGGVSDSQLLFITVVESFPPPHTGTLPPGFPQVIIELGINAAAPQVPAGTLLLDDPVYGKLDSGKLGDSTQWTDVTGYARSGSTSRPSSRTQGPLIAYQPGTGSIVLKNDTGIFDPANASSPYAGSLRTMVPFRVRAIYASAEYHLFSGFTDSWGAAGTNWGPHYTEITVTATDGFKVLSGVTIPATGGPAGDGEDTGARVTRILNAASWYTDHRKIDTGDTIVQGTTFGSDALSLLQLTADNEAGDLYIDGSGNLVFRHRQAAFTDTRSTAPQAIFGDSPGTVHGSLTELPYSAITRADDDAQLCNDVQATTQGGTLQRAQDKTSQRTYLFPRSYDRSDLILEDDPTTLQWAQWVLSVSLSPQERFDQLSVTPLRDPVNLFPQVLGREIGDLIQVIRRPPNVAAITKSLFIRGISHTVDVSSNTWSTVFDLQDASKYTGFLLLDDAVRGKLDSGNKLAF